MRKLIILMLAAVAVISLGSCRRVSHNGKLDGHWQIREIYNIETGVSEYPTQKFISVQLELMQLQNPRQSADLTGVLTHHKGDPEVIVDFRNNPTEARLAEFGFKGNPTTLHIDRLDSKHLVLSSPMAVITCRRF